MRLNVRVLVLLDLVLVADGATNGTADRATERAADRAVTLDVPLFVLSLVARLVRHLDPPVRKFNLSLH